MAKEDIQFTDVSGQLSSIITPSSMEEEYIINSNKEYQALLDSQFSRSKSADVPSTDFSKNTLLGQYVFSSGCSVDFTEKVYKDRINKKIIFSINVDKKGYCDSANVGAIWVVIPKIPSDSDYTVEFDVKECILSSLLCL